jgi:hypothetical protein
MDWGVFPVYAHNPDYDSLDGKVGSGVYVGPLGWFRLNHGDVSLNVSL